MFIVLIQFLAIYCLEVSTITIKDKSPTIFIAILARNKAHALPYFLTLLSQIDYPKDRITVWIRSDHNQDNTADILNEWYHNFHSEYHTVDMVISNWPKNIKDEQNSAHWTDSRFKHVIQLRESALDTARNAWADYIWFLDCDSFVTDRSVLKNLIEKKRVVVAPMLVSDSMYSNFWCGMTPEYYYQRTDEYEKILKREIVGSFQVPMIHSAVFIDLRSDVSDLLTFLPNKVADYDGPVDDIIVFAIAAHNSGIPLYLCNDVLYGYTSVPLKEHQSIDDDKILLTNLKLFITVNEPALPVYELFLPYVQYPSKSKFGFDQISVINLKRRTERKNRMLNCLQELGIDATFIEAVDGKELNNKELENMNIFLMPDYEDPYHKRPMKKGEIGCFLSHYKIWQEIVDRNYNEVLILEDDVRFEKFFINTLKELIAEIRQPSLVWDLIYLGRKILKSEEEKYIEGSAKLVSPHYSYWTLGYIISRTGAQKLIDSEPLTKLIPVDEFLPIMYDKHSRDDWKTHFPNRNLIALSVNPLIIFPMKYVNEEGYISDTESSRIIDANDIQKDEL